jgi:hypothetical protein
MIQNILVYKYIRGYLWSQKYILYILREFKYEQDKKENSMKEEITENELCTKHTK